MSKATVTVREVRNKNTGIDLTIPSLREVAGMFGSTTEYEIVVVTSLSSFKSPRHAETDVVQFMVAKKLSDFEALRHKLEERFSGTVFPMLPKKGLFSGSGDGKERRTSIDNFMKFIACTPTLATCPLMLHFLGASRGKSLLSTGHISIVDDTGRESVEENGATSVSPEKISELFGEEEVDGEDLFPEVQDEAVVIEPEPVFHTVLVERFDFGNRSTTKSRAEPQLFSEQDYGGPVDIDAMLLLGGDLDEEEDAALSKRLPDEDNSELLNIEDDLDQLFLKLKPQKNSIPEVTDNANGKLFSSDTSKNHSNIDTTDTLPVSPTLSKPNKPVKPQLPNKPCKPPLSAKPTKPVAADRPTIAKRPTKTKIEAAAVVESPPLPLDDKVEVRPVPKPRSRVSRTSSSTSDKGSDEINVTGEKPSQGSLKGDEGVSTADMDADNLLKYIEENTSADNADLDLFS